jgi:hypothetical protein
LIETTSNRDSGSTDDPINGLPNCPAANAAASIAPVTMGTVSDSTATAASTRRFDSVRRRPIRLARIASMRALMSAPPTPATLISGVST